MRHPVWGTGMPVGEFYLDQPPQPSTPTFWLPTGLVTLLVLLFSAYFIFYLTGRQDAYMTNAEDLGIIDQAIWSTLHGHLLHQSICNIVSDTNCYNFNGISRFAIHFEPILFPVSLLYLIWPNPKTLLVLQTLVVASGAFPAFWLARLRLRNAWAGVAIALLYLLFPAQQNALVFDFHAVTFTAALLLFTLYFMYTRRTAWLFVFAILAMACKEEIPLLIAVLALWSMLFQRRWRSSLALLLLAIAWTGLALLVIHLYSPTGHSLLASRYAYLGSNPLQIARTLLLHPTTVLKQHLLDNTHRTYLASLLAPAGYLPLLAPWILILALPTLALNMFSSDPTMYSGIFQYNAEIVPALLFATIEAMALILRFVEAGSRGSRSWRGFGRTLPGGQVIPQPPDGRPQGPTQPVLSPLAPTIRRCILRPCIVGAGRVRRRVGTLVVARRLSCGRPSNSTRLLQRALLAIMLIYALFSVISSDYTSSPLPFARGFRWPHITTHTELAQHFLDMIPPTASVSAQTRLVPHLSQRLNIYLFPYADDRADYIFLDVTGDRYPYFDPQAYNREVQKVLQSGNYSILAAEDGYLLLKHASSALIPFNRRPISPGKTYLGTG